MGKIRKLVPSTKVVIEFTFLIFHSFACIHETKKRINTRKKKKRRYSYYVQGNTRKQNNLFL